jgi:hypothetical protein
LILRYFAENYNPKMAWNVENKNRAKCRLEIGVEEAMAL